MVGTGVEAGWGTTAVVRDGWTAERRGEEWTEAS